MPPNTIRGEMGISFYVDCSCGVLILAPTVTVARVHANECSILMAM